jgi:hypothetical protein
MQGLQTIAPYAAWGRQHSHEHQSCTGPALTPAIRIKDLVKRYADQQNSRQAGAGRRQL